MGTRRKKSKKSPHFPFLKLLSLGLLVGAGVWIWQKSFPLKTSSPLKRSSSSSRVQQPVKTSEIKPVEISTPSVALKPSATPLQPPASPKAQSVSAVFPKDAWGDNYLKVQAGFRDSTPDDFLVSFGSAPSGTDPEKIRNPEKLHPHLVLVKKEKEGFVKKTEFNFPTQSVDSALQKNQLAGMPRITPESFIDLDNDGSSELIVMLDTHTQWPEAVAFLKYEKGEFKWIKTQQEGKQKLALWPVGSNPSESREIIPKGLNTHQPEIIEKIGRIDPDHPEKGLVWKKRIWIYKKGVFELKSQS